MLERASVFVKALEGSSDFLENPRYLPAPQHRLRALSLLGDTRPRIVIFGQDPYPNAASACGIAFLDANISAFTDKAIAPSLRNLYKGLMKDYGFKWNSTDELRKLMQEKLGRHGTIQGWFEALARAGVVWLNAALTFESDNDTNKHQKFWRPLVQQLVQKEFKNEVVYVLMGGFAQKLEKLLPAGSVAIKTKHPVMNEFCAEGLFTQLKQAEERLFGDSIDFISANVVAK